MNPAKEAALKTQVREACLILVNGGVATRKDLFGDTGSYGRYTLILQSLENAGLIESTLTKPGGAKLFAVKDPDRLQEIADSDVELSRLIWPGRNGTPPTTEEISLDDSTEEVPVMTPKVDEATLKMLVAIVENMIYMRGKIDTIETQVGALSAVACAHCSRPEEHQ